MEDARVRYDVSSIHWRISQLCCALLERPQQRSHAPSKTQHAHSLADESIACRYTGYIRGMGETFAKTPVMAQWETKEPSPDSFLYARSKVCTLTYLC